MSRAFPREGVRRGDRGAARRQPVGDHDRPERALEEWLAKQLGGGARSRLLARSAAFQYFVAAAPGARELITIAKVWELAQLERWDRQHRTLRPRHRRRARLRPRPGDAHHAADVRRDRARRADPRAGARGPRRCSPTPTRTGYVAVALPEEMPVNETLELEERLPERVGLGLDAIVVNGVVRDRYSAPSATRCAATRPAPVAARAAPARSERARAAQPPAAAAARATRAGGHAPVPVRRRASGCPSTSGSPRSRAQADAAPAVAP